MALGSSSASTGLCSNDGAYGATQHPADDSATDLARPIEARKGKHRILSRDPYTQWLRMLVPTPIRDMVRGASQNQ